MSISFNTITNTLVPGQYIEFDNSFAVRGLTADATKTLIFGQYLSSVSPAPAMIPQRIQGAEDAAARYGRGSMLHEMVAAFREINTENDVWVLPIPDLAAGVQATGSVAFAGAATEARTMYVYIGGKQNAVGVAVGDTAATVATATAAAINANADLPVIATAAAGTVTITARHKGMVYNGYDIRLAYYDADAIPKGITAVITAMAGGSGNPAMLTALAALGETQYHYVLTPYTDTASIAPLTMELESRLGGMRQIDGHAFAGLSGTFATLSTAGAALNSPCLSVIGANGAPNPPHIWAAKLASVASFYLDIDPARPIQNLTLTGLLAPKSTFTRSEQNLLLRDGISTFNVAPDGSVVISRVVTTYQTNSAGATDPSYRNIETMATLSILRRTARNWLNQKFQRHKLASDGTRVASGQAIATPTVVKAEWIALGRAWEENGWVETVDVWKDKIIVERNLNDVDRLDSVVTPDIINQLRVMATQIAFIL
jgi:phage tail sheath gpL-like